MRKTLDFILYSNLFVAICAAFLCLFIHEVFKLYTYRLQVTSFIFFSTLGAYNFHRLFGIKKVTKKNTRTLWVRKNLLLIKWLSIFSIIAACIIYLFFPFSTILFLLPLSLISLWYVVGLLKYGKLNQPLREIPYLKIFLISFVWAGACCMFPLVVNSGYGILLNIHVQLFCLAIALFVFALCLPFDIRDFQDDHRMNIQTIPHGIGIYWTKMLSNGMFIFSALIILILYFHGFIDQASTIAFIMTCITCIIFVVFISPSRKDYYYSLFMESCLLMPFFIHLLISRFFSI